MPTYDNPYQEGNYDLVAHGYTSNDFPSDKYNVIILVEMDSKKPKLTTADLKILLKGWYDGEVGELKFSDITERFDGQLAFCIQVEKDEDIALIKARLGTDPNNYNKRPANYPEKVRSLEIFSNDVNQKNLFATWKSMEPWPEPHFLDFIAGDLDANRMHSRLARRSKGKQ